jgi:hypothetical protein
VDDLLIQKTLLGSWSKGDDASKKDKDIIAQGDSTEGHTPHKSLTKNNSIPFSVPADACPKMAFIQRLKHQSQGQVSRTAHFGLRRDYLAYGLR